MTLVRASLSVHSSPNLVSAYQSLLARLSAEGVDVGENYHSREFLTDVVFLSARCLQAYNADDLQKALPGTGIRPDFALLFDGVPVGGISLHGRHGSVHVICLCFCSPYTLKLHARLITWFVSDQGHGGDALATNTLAALARPPISLSLADLDRSLCIIGGDGAVVTGGVAREKPGTQAAEILWLRTHPVAGRLPRNGQDWRSDRHHLHRCTEWDKFHREDLSVNRAVSHSHMAWEVFDVCKELDILFSYGDGRLLLQTAAQFVGAVPRRANTRGQVRKTGALAQQPEVLLRNLKAYSAGLHLRLSLLEERMMTGQTKEALIAVGRRMLALDFVAFACLFCSIAHQVIEPWAATIQSSACEPWVVAKQRQRHQTLAQEYLDTLFWSRGFLRVLTLLRQHTPAQELVALARAAFFATPATFFHSARGLTTCFGRRLPLYMLSLPNFIADATPFFNGTELQVTVPGEKARLMCLGPHCTCSFLAGRGQQFQAPGKHLKSKTLVAGGMLKGKPVRYMSCWVANASADTARPQDTLYFRLSQLSHMLTFNSHS